MKNLLKNNFLNRVALAAWLQRSRQAPLLIIVLALGWVGLRGQTQLIPTPNDRPGAPMKQFVFLFRQGATQLSEADQKRRAEEVRAWALRQNNEGRKLVPHILGQENYRVSPDGKGGPDRAIDGGTLIAITFLEARDFAEAVRIAETHPGLRYGVSVEVRAWTSPLAAPADSRR
jgi:hypothetical protein